MDSNDSQRRLLTDKLAALARDIGTGNDDEKMVISVLYTILGALHSNDMRALCSCTVAYASGALERLTKERQ